MNRTKQILIVGLSAIALMVVLKGIGNRFSHPPKTIERVVAVPTNKINYAWDYHQDPQIVEIHTNKDGAVYGKEIQTVRMDQEPERFKKMKAAMTETLGSLGIEAKERTVQRLVTAMIKSDQSELPDHFKTADWAALESFKLKRAIARELKTEDELTLKRVIETPLVKRLETNEAGWVTKYFIMFPPMSDYKLRTGPDAVFNEAKAIEAAK